MQYENPVVRGFNPDPSIICADGVFYMVNSTFQYFPAVIIRKSLDLINWEIVGHAITHPEWITLSDVPDSHGIWAPDISYANGKYWIFAPLRLSGEGNREHTVLRRQLVMWADHPQGPYSKPICLEVDSIDPSHFVDDDGKHYLITAPGITITPLSDDCTVIAGETKTIWAGTGERAPEGPHVFKKDGWYYAILAEGGTGYGHQVSVARSRTLFGAYTPCPHNPVLRQADIGARLQRCGHAKFLQLPDERWFAVYLCARPLRGNLTILGRETALQPLDWDADGWPVMGQVCDTVDLPFPHLGGQKLGQEWTDDFNEPALHKEWQFVRTPSAEWTLTERPGCLRIWTEDGDLFERRARNVLVRRETEHVYHAQVRLFFHPQWDGEQAGLCCYYSTNSYIKCAITTQGVVLSYRCGEEREIQVACMTMELGQWVNLGVWVNGLKRTFRVQGNDKVWTDLGTLDDCSFLSDEGIKSGKRHTGTMVGIFATNGSCGSRVPADFDRFVYVCAY